MKKYGYDWDIANSIYDIFKSKIEYSTSLQVINLKSLDVDPSRLDLVDADLFGRKWKYNEENELLRLRLLEQGIYAFVYISDGKTKVFDLRECVKHEDVTEGDRVFVRCAKYDTLDFYSDGYGLFSTTLDSGGYDSDSVSYYASASFDYAIEVIQPPIDLVELADFRKIRAFSAKNKKMAKIRHRRGTFGDRPETELGRARDHILSYFDSLADLTVKYLRGGEVK